MIIDFHTHAFPDALAKKATDALIKGAREGGGGFDDTLFSDGTGGGLVRSMDKAGVDRSVLLPVATKPGQADGINRWAEEFAKNKRIIPFGAFYPSEDWEERLEALAEQGYRGIKLHGEFQGFYADDERMINVYRRCGEYGMICVMHAGVDCSSPRDVRVTPERMARVFQRVSGTDFVLAHMGGVRMEDKAAELLHGAEHLWVDTSYAAGRLTPEKMGELIGLYGADRVLFGSDSPWNDPADVIELLKAAVPEREKLEMILGTNAEKLLGGE